MTAENTIRPRNKRTDTPSVMRFQKRDGEVLQAIYQYDGVLARRHLKEMFWPDKTGRAMEMRLSRLYHQAYLDWPSAEQRQTKPIPEPVCWLGWKGALWLAGERGTPVEQPKTINESQLRVLERRLREGEINWLREPRWSQLKHDLAIVDVRLAVEKAVKELPVLTLETWIPESVFHSQMDVVQFALQRPGGRVNMIQKGVRPDGYFEIVDQKRQQQSLPARARFLIEIDQATHDNPSFGREKVAPGLAYLRSQAYKVRFGDNAGRWLIITTGQTRLKNLITQTRQSVGPAANVFFFAVFDELDRANFLTSPIWWQAGKKEKVALLSK